MNSIKLDYPLGSNIAGLRRLNGLTQDQVIAKLQIWKIPVSKSRYAKIETNRINVRVRELVALKHIFSCSYNDFFIGLDDMLKKEIEAVFGNYD